MFQHRFKLFEVWGFSVYIDATWLVLAFLVTWTLADGLFPHYYPDLSTTTYWWMGVAGAIGLFASIIFHELSHSLVARKYGIPMAGITLFIFGGMSEMHTSPPNAKSEFLMAVVGPLSSLLLAGILYGVLFIVHPLINTPIIAILQYLTWINVVLAIFNSIPAFPLDGGRILRAALWGWKKDYYKATRIAAKIGAGFGLALILLGFLNVFSGQFIGGFWYVLLGLFVRGAANLSYRRQLMRQTLGEDTVQRFMRQEVVTVPSSISVDDLVENYVYRYRHRMFPVEENKSLLGWVTLDRIKSIPQRQWKTTDVKTITERYSANNTVPSSSKASQVFQKMTENSVPQLMVVDEGSLVGIISLKDFLKFFDLKIALEGNSEYSPLSTNNSSKRL